MPGQILFLGHRLPFPPDRGDKIRSHHILRHLAGLAPVHVATFADDAADLAAEPSLRALAESYCLVQRRKPLAWAGMQALWQGEPVSVAAFHDPRLAHYVSAVLRDYPIATIYVFSSQMGQYIPASFAGRIITDFVDVDSAKFDAYAQDRRNWRRLIDAREGRLLRTEEARLARRSTVSLLISEAEAALFRDRLDGPSRAAADVQVLGNGIDVGGFDPGGVMPEPQLAALTGPKLIFTGQMDYAPNIAAVQRATQRIMPLIRASVPDASLHIVGRNPAGAVRALLGINGCHVWGRVADIRPWLGAADLALVPLEIARGVQNKVLEAMAMELPVVLTTGAATGIPAIAGQHFAVADSDADLAARAIELCRDATARAAMGSAARQFVTERMSWAAALAPLQSMIDPAQSGAPRRAV